MMKTHFIHLFPAVAAVLFGGFLAANVAQADTCGSVAGNVVQNCGFETGDFTGWTYTGNLEGGAPPNNYYGVDNSNPNSGNDAAYIGVQGGGGSNIGGLGPFLTLSQTLNLLPSEYYQVSFYLDQNAPTPNPGYLNYFGARFNGAYVFTEENVPNSGGAYRAYTYRVSTPVGATAASASMLAFNFQNDSDFFFLDDVSVTALGPTPEPASFLLVVPVLGGLYLLRRRRVSA